MTASNHTLPLSPFISPPPPHASTLTLKLWELWQTDCERIYVGSISGSCSVFLLPSLIRIILYNRTFFPVTSLSRCFCFLNSSFCSYMNTRVFVPHVTSVWKWSEVIRKPQTRFLLYNIFLSRNTYRHNALFLLSHTNIISNMNIIYRCLQVLDFCSDINGI